MKSQLAEVKTTTNRQTMIRNKILTAFVHSASVSGALSLALMAGNAKAEGQLNVICSVQAEWCSMIATVYTKTTGVKVNIVQKGSGEAIAQINAESANPKTDVWFGGTGDPHLQAAEQGLTLEYKSPSLNTLHPWAVQQAEQSGYKTVGIYAGPLGVAYNTVMRAIVALEAGGVVAKVGDGKRDRVFCARAILDILDEPARLTPDAPVARRRTART